jgi:hypothetical protein
VDRRVLTGACAALAGVAVAGGVLVATSGGESDDGVRLDRTRDVESPSLGTNAAIAGEPLRR